MKSKPIPGLIILLGLLMTSLYVFAGNVTIVDGSKIIDMRDPERDSNYSTLEILTDANIGTGNCVGQWIKLTSTQSLKSTLPAIKMARWALNNKHNVVVITRSTGSGCDDGNRLNFNSMRP